MGERIASARKLRDLSARTIELMRWAAARSDDPALAGVAAYVRAETFFSNQRPAAGLRALDAACRPLIADGSRDTLAIYGSLHMRAGVLAACAGLAETADSYLAEARDVGGGSVRRPRSRCRRGAQ